MPTRACIVRVRKENKIAKLTSVARRFDHVYNHPGVTEPSSPGIPIPATNPEGHKKAPKDEKKRKGKKNSRPTAAGAVAPVPPKKTTNHNPPVAGALAPAFQRRDQDKENQVHTHSTKARTKRQKETQRPDLYNITDCEGAGERCVVECI